MTCPNCQSPVADDARFCSNCGQDLSRRHDERRVVTVLFADIVGFTGLSEARDPEQVKNLVDRCFALLADDITAFGGRVDKVIGDAIVALFGAPIAHEDDAERAVRAGLRMQETVQRFDADTGVGIRVRIGVNTGEVLVGALSAGDDYTAMGDVVNTASRLQTAAEPGAVLVGATTQAATADVIHYRSVGLLHARGREEPVRAYRAVEPVGRPGERLAGPDLPLVGRDPELDLVRNGIAAAFGRSRAQLVTLFGESGVGKTRLAAEVAAIARRDHRALSLHGRCLPYGEANVWWPIAEALRAEVGIDDRVDPDEVPGIVTAAVADAFGPGADETTVARTAEGLRHLFGYETGLSRLEPDRANDEGVRAVRAYLDAVSRRAPVLLWLSDIDWADDAVLRLLDDVLDRLARRPVVVMVTGGSEVMRRWSPSSGRFNALSIAIEPLEAGAAGVLARELLPGVDDDVVARVVERSGGNPLFLAEMARMVDAAGGDEVGPLPANVRSVISARLDALDAAALHVVEDAAVLGLRGSVEALARMAEFERDTHDISASLRTLERCDLLDVSGTHWSFRSNVVRDVVYSRLTKTDRAWRHAGIANWIESNATKDSSETIAYHYRRAARHARELGGVEGFPPDVAEKALEWTLQAARSTSGASAVERAEQLFSDALELMADTDPRKAEVHLERAAAALTRLDTATARLDIDAAQPLVEASGDPALAVRHRLLASELAQWSSDQDGALVLGESALTLAHEMGDAALAADALRRIGMVRLFRGEHEQSETCIERALQIYEELGDASGLAWARQNLAWIAYVEGDMALAERRLETAVRAFEELGDLAGTAWSRGLLAYARIHEGRFAEAEDLAHKTLAESRDRGDHWGQGMMLVALAITALWTGRVDEAIRRAGKARALFPIGSDPIGPAQALAVQARALIRSGRIAEGLRLLDDALDDELEESARQILETSLAAAAATVGDVAFGRRALPHESTLDIDRLGESDRMVAGALSALQRGDVAGAARLREVMPADVDAAGSLWGWAVLSLVAAARGEDADPFVDRVETSPRATYTDRVLARIATACVAARAGDETATRVALDRAYEAVPIGGDRIHPTIVALAEARCLATLGTADAAEAEVRAIKTAAAVGLDTTGWRTALAVACGERVGASMSQAEAAS